MISEISDGFLALREIEMRADTAYGEQASSDARRLLRHSTQEAFGATEQDLFYRHAIKLIAAPAYADFDAIANAQELLHSPEAKEMYIQAGQLLAFLLDELALNGSDKRFITNRKKLAGSMSEIVPFAIGARLRSLGTFLTIVTTSAKVDMGKRSDSADFIAAFRQQEGYALCPFQTKYKATEDDIAHYNVPVVSYSPEGVNSLSRQDHSLASAIIRDTEGVSTRQDIVSINYATTQLLTILYRHYEIDL